MTTKRRQLTDEQIAARASASTVVVLNPRHHYCPGLRPH